MSRKAPLSTVWLPDGSGPTAKMSQNLLLPTWGSMPDAGSPRTHRCLIAPVPVTHISSPTCCYLGFPCTYELADCRQPHRATTLQPQVLTWSHTSGSSAPSSPQPPHPSPHPASPQGLVQGGPGSARQGLRSPHASTRVVCPYTVSLQAKYML